MFGKWEDNKITVYGPATTEPGWYPIVKQYSSIDYNTEQVEYRGVYTSKEEQALIIVEGSETTLTVKFCNVSRQSVSDDKSGVEYSAVVPAEQVERDRNLPDLVEWQPNDIEEVWN